MIWDDHLVLISTNFSLSVFEMQPVRRTLTAYNCFVLTGLKICQTNCLRVNFVKDLIFDNKICQMAGEKSCVWLAAYGSDWPTLEPFSPNVRLASKMATAKRAFLF